MACVAASDQLIAQSPETVAAAVRAIVRAQQLLKGDVDLAKAVGKKLFPAMEADAITDIIKRDLPYYEASISRDAVARMVGFSQKAGILTRTPSYQEIVAAQFEPLWRQ
jgi:ABC-type nitrate/sulfonate/bicarbonate transport system substrate-binding protein